MSGEHDSAGRRISLATVKELTGCTTQEQVFNRVRAGRLPRPLSLEPLEWDLAAVHAAIAADPRLREGAPWNRPNQGRGS